MLAAVGDDEAIVDPHSSPSSLAVAGVDPTAALLATARSGSVEAIAVAPDGRVAVSLERDTSAHAVVVRRLPSLLPTARVEIAGDAVDVGFAGERPIVCAGHGVLAVTHGALEPLGAPFATAVRMAASKDGRRAALVRPDGAIEVVTLPEGKHLAGVSSQSNAQAALDETGARLAVLTGGRIRLFEVRDEGASLLDDELRLGTGVGLAFGPDDHLYAWDNDEVHVYAPDTNPAPRAIPMTFEPPAGFRKAVFRDGSLTFSRFDEESEWVPPNLVERWRRPSKHARHRRSRAPQIDVWVYALDPAELDASDLDAWKNQMALRYGEMTVLRAWVIGKDKSIEYVSFRRDGCDPVDEYVRMTERDGVLYRIVMQVPPETRTANVPFATVFDEPFDDRGPSRLAVASPPVPPGPC